MATIDVQMPEAFKELLTTNYRYKAYYGGRGGGKTYSFALAFIILALSRKIKVLACREIMKSIKESVYEVLILTMKRLGVEEQFDCTNNEITCKITGSKFLFAGLFRNVEKIKSIPELTHAWVNESDKCSDESLTLLMPTVREELSEVWFEWNPGFPDDAVHKRFVENPPPNALVREVSWKDNPFISQTLLDEKDTDYAMRPEEASHIWGGQLKNYGANVWAPPFDSAIHTKEFNLKDIKDVKYFQALDPHTSFYSASIWAARWPTIGGKYITWIYDEWPRYSTINAFYSDVRNKLHYQGSVADLARAFFAAETGIQVTQRYIDTRFAKGFGSQQSNLINTTKGLVEDFADPKNGGILYIMPAEKNIDGANDDIKSALRYNKLQDISDLNKPTLYISANCKNVLRALKLHRYEEGMEREMETYKDYSDCLTILFGGLSEYRWPIVKKHSSGRDSGPGSWQGN